MSGDTLTTLERKIDELIALSERLRQENHALRERENRLLRERGKLLEKNEQARVHVENMISRFKSLNLEK
ncbi:MAG: TIGR02449 family protein [Porticoccaceae bacterium]